MNKTYPVGTKIKYIGYCKECNGKIGRVVGVREHTCNITLPSSTCGIFDDGSTMQCPWSAIIPVLLVKNQQLLFDFMQQS